MITNIQSGPEKDFFDRCSLPAFSVFFLLGKLPNLAMISVFP